MAAKRKVFNWLDFSTSNDEHQANRSIFEWLGDDGDRALLYQSIRDHAQGVIRVKSRAKFLDDPAPLKSSLANAAGGDVYLVANRKLINQVFTDAANFSNAPYLDLGSGAFMLGLDPAIGSSNGSNPSYHALQCRALEAALPKRIEINLVKNLCDQAVAQASVMAFKGKNIDAADFAEQAALRFCIALFGFTLSDYSLLEDALRKSYRAMNYQMLARHFVTEPLTLPSAREAMARLGTRIGQLLDEYQRLPSYPRWDERRGDPRAEQRFLPEGVEVLAGVNYTPVIAALAALNTKDYPLTGQERVVIVVGTLAGIVANIQASCAGALHAIFEKNKAHSLADVASNEGKLWAEIALGMNANPPAPYLPRLVVADRVTLGEFELQKGDEIILMLGAGTNDGARACPFSQQPEDSLVFGFGSDSHKGAGYSPHWCVGDYLARPLIHSVVKTILELPGIARRLDPISAEPLGLEKRWGFGCEKFPLTYKRETLRKQQSLNVVMRIKAPTAEHAERLKRVIRDGAPRIERALIEARHVHFAWFEIIENDTKLVLHTVYDGDFEAYLDHFALKIDEMFDQLFLSIEGAPPLPVRDYANEFIEAIRRYNQAPLGGYFFSAYPQVESNRIVAKQSDLI